MNVQPDSNSERNLWFTCQDQDSGRKEKKIYVLTVFAGFPLNLHMYLFYKSFLFIHYSSIAAKVKWCYGMQKSKNPVSQKISHSEEEQ